MTLKWDLLPDLEVLSYGALCQHPVLRPPLINLVAISCILYVSNVFNQIIPQQIWSQVTQWRNHTKTTRCGHLCLYVLDCYF